VNDTSLRAIAALAVLLVGGPMRLPARGDEAPTDAPETCTLEKQQKPGEECLMCGVSQSDPAKCLKILSQKGYQRRCRASGSPVWLEAWCRPRGGEAQKKPAKPAPNDPLGY
jgi:hypothetical protein